jgi:isopenicillin-N epimerase
MANIMQEIGRAEQTLKAPHHEYEAPLYPIPMLPDPSNFEKTSFGKETRKHFKLHQSITFLNHGSYGATPKVVHNIQGAWKDLMEEQPVQFMSNNMFTYLYDNIRTLSQYINADADDVMLVENATSGCNAVLKSLNYKEGENILYLSLGYGAVNNTIDYISKRYKLERNMVNIDLPINMEKIITDFENSITPLTKICVIDHITSATGLVLPIKRFIDIAHKKGTLILVDAAHAVGHVPIDIKALGADFYTSNLHKWVCAPKGCAFLHIDKKYKDDIYPLCVSHGQNLSTSSRFIFMGTRDYSAFLCIKPSFDFFKYFGVEECHLYQRTLIREAYQLLISRFNTCGVLETYNDEYIGKFATIKLPLPNVEFPGKNNVEKSISMQNQLYEKYKIEVPFMVLNEEFYIRISAQIYNELSEYQFLADSLIELLNITS